MDDIRPFESPIETMKKRWLTKIAGFWRYHGILKPGSSYKNEFFGELIKLITVIYENVGRIRNELIMIIAMGYYNLAHWKHETIVPKGQAR